MIEAPFDVEIKRPFGEETARGGGEPKAGSSKRPAGGDLEEPHGKKARHEPRGEKGKLDTHHSESCRKYGNNSAPPIIKELFKETADRSNLLTECKDLKSNFVVYVPKHCRGGHGPNTVLLATNGRFFAKKLGKRIFGRCQKQKK
jgi:hypothetical protein